MNTVQKEKFLRCQEQAKEGDDYAQYALGLYYLDGDEIPKNYIEAVKWLKKSAEQGNEEAQNYLGTCYHHGKGVEKNDEKAAEWILLSAKKGFCEAQVNLGKFYIRGVGLLKSKILGYCWLTLSLQKDCLRSAQELLDGLEKGMTFEEVNNAQQIVKEWYAK